MADKHPHQERTLVVLKPDTIRRGLMGNIITRFENAGLKITAMKMMVPDGDQLVKHYNKDDAWYLEKGTRIVNEMTEAGETVDKEPIEYGKEIINMMVTYMTDSPVLAMIVEGNMSVAVVTKMVGGTEPTTADIGTIRGDLTVDSYGHSSYEKRGVRNLVHCSDSVEEAAREIALWFTDDEIHQYRTAMEAIMYDN